ncbi:MAG TPA: T9SS type A sorting domain-containing protein, partial [Bacteroidia bacterium]|nr:T9SS type A sorting domain-containing protein [Bacteroidia bacterium]
PWINWINCSTIDSIPVVDDIPYSDINGYTGSAIFPDSNNYASLPTLTWVIPNSINDMHDGNESSALPAGDSWFKANMMPLVRWCANPANNSVLFVTWDEDDNSEGNKVVMMACSGLIVGGTYNTRLNHYSWLKTIEDMYGATECSNAATAVDFPASMWKVSAIPSINQSAQLENTWPNPAKDELNVGIMATNDAQTTFAIYDVTGRLAKELPAKLRSGENTVTLSTTDVAAGIYFLKITGDNINICNKITVVK